MGPEPAEPPPGPAQPPVSQVAGEHLTGAATTTANSRVSWLGWLGTTGPGAATLFHRLLSLIFLVAWLSLLAQVQVLIGSRGLMPFVELVEALRDEGLLSPAALPSVLALFPSSDTAISAGALVGVVLALLGLAGVAPRVIATLQTALYLSYVAACRTFLAFQWDNLLLECGLLAAFLPADRRAPVIHLLLRALIFKLYFESGLAKWQSPLHDWQDGSAMTFYYETAPLPTPLAWRAHHLPRAWHLVESWTTLVLELVLPWLCFGPRRARLTAALGFTLFQVGNALTGNYGFFCYLSVALHALLLDDTDLARVRARARSTLARPLRVASARATLAALHRGATVVRSLFVRSRDARKWPTIGAQGDMPGAAPARNSLALARLRRGAAFAGAGLWAFVSLVNAWFQFGAPGPGSRPLVPILELAQTFRLVNNYHLFASVTRERIEPEVQTEVNGVWSPQHFRYKPGPIADPPRFVAPHQPRVDFQLWFYGLAYSRRPPLYVMNLLARLCEDPAAVRLLFRSPLPAAPDAVRVVFWDYRFSSPDAMRASGAWWTRRQIATSDPVRCAR